MLLQSQSQSVTQWVILAILSRTMSLQESAFQKHHCIGNSNKQKFTAQERRGRLWNQEHGESKMRFGFWDNPIVTNTRFLGKTLFCYTLYSSQCFLLLFKVPFLFIGIHSVLLYLFLKGWLYYYYYYFQTFLYFFFFARFLLFPTQEYLTWIFRSSPGTQMLWAPNYFSSVFLAKLFIFILKKITCTQLIVF